MTLHAMHGQFCSHCGEGIWDEESYRRYTEAQEGLVRAVKGDSGADIRRIRKKLNITQANLALAFEGKWHFHDMNVAKPALRHR